MRHADPCPWCGVTPCADTCDAGDLPAASVFWICFGLALLAGFIVLLVVL